MEANNVKNLSQKRKGANNGKNLPDEKQSMANKSREANNSQKMLPKILIPEIARRLLKFLEAINGQNSEEHVDKKTNAEAGGSPCCWKSPPPKMHNHYCGVFEVSQELHSLCHKRWTLGRPPITEED